MLTLWKYLLCGLIAMTFSGCGGKSDPWGDYKMVIESGRKKIPWVRNVEMYFPVENIDHFITHYGFDREPRTWQTVVYFQGRYRMQIVQDISIDYRKKEVTGVVGEMDFVINEVIRIDENLESTYGKQARGKKVEWEKFEKSGGKLSALPLRIELDQPLERFDEMRAAWGKGIIK
jgi:hypothetical protein